MCGEDETGIGSGNHCDNFDNPKIMRLTPTIEELKDFDSFIANAERQGAHHAGVCIVTLPKGFTTVKGGSIETALENYKFKAIQQYFRGSAGKYTLHRRFKKNDAGRADALHQDFTRESFMEYASKTEQRISKLSIPELEKKFWSDMRKKKTRKFPFYGTDVDGTLMDENSEVLNFDKLGTILDFLHLCGGDIIDGVHTSFLYFGSWGSAFPWHAEDQDLYSINILHEGKPKVWYAIPIKHAEKMHKLAQKHLSKATGCASILRHKQCFFSPDMLKANGIEYNMVVQQPGEVIITFPLGIHAGFNAGYNLAQAVNFASERWIPYGENAKACSCTWSDDEYENGTADVMPKIDAKTIKFLLSFLKKYMSARNSMSGLSANAILDGSRSEPLVSISSSLSCAGNAVENDGLLQTFEDASPAEPVACTSSSSLSCAENAVENDGVLQTFEDASPAKPLASTSASLSCAGNAVENDGLWQTFEDASVAEPLPSTSSSSFSSSCAGNRLAQSMEDVISTESVASTSSSSSCVGNAVAPDQVLQTTEGSFPIVASVSNDNEIMGGCEMDNFDSTDGFEDKNEEAGVECMEVDESIAQLTGTKAFLTLESEYQGEIINSQTKLLNLYKGVLKRGLNNSKTYSKQFVPAGNQRIRKGPKICDKCGRVYASQRTLSQHIRNKHKGETYICDLCGIILANQGNVQRHKKNMHVNQ